MFNENKGQWGTSKDNLLSHSHFTQVLTLSYKATFRSRNKIISSPPPFPIPFIPGRLKRIKGSGDKTWKGRDSQWLWSLPSLQSVALSLEPWHSQAVRIPGRWPHHHLTEPALNPAGMKKRETLGSQLFFFELCAPHPSLWGTSHTPQVFTLNLFLSILPEERS